jgi:hypothetical protein
MAGFDVNQIKGNDRIIAGAGIVVFIASFLPWYGVSSGGFSVSTSGWSAGGLAMLAILLGIASAAFVVARSMGQMTDMSMPIGPALLALALSALSLLFILIRWASLPRYGGVIHAGARIGLYLALLAVIAQVVAAAMSFRTSGEKLPGSTQGPSSPPHPTP